MAKYIWNLTQCQPSFGGIRSHNYIE